MQLLFPILLLLLFPLKSFAACTQEAIQFYLDKGFSQEQVTKLCTTTFNEADAYQPYQKPVVIVQEGYASGINANENKAINALRGGIEGRSIDITPLNVNYIRKVCIVWKESPNVEQWINKCIDVAFSLSREDLKVNESGLSLLILGEQKIEISSASIKRKHVTSDPWAGFSLDKRHILQRKYETFEKGNTTIIPLRRSADPGRMVNAIRTLSDATKVKNNKSISSSEVTRVLNDSYVPPTEEEYIASQPTYKEAQEKKKKNKKWWNPFD